MSLVSTIPGRSMAPVAFHSKNTELRTFVGCATMITCTPGLPKTHWNMWEVWLGSSTNVGNMGHM